MVVPLLVVFLSNSLWGYLPLSRDVAKVPYYVHATNAMRDLQVAVLHSALIVQMWFLSEHRDDPEKARNELEESFDKVQSSFAVVRRKGGRRMALGAGTDISGLCPMAGRPRSGPRPCRCLLSNEGG